MPHCCYGLCNSDSKYGPSSKRPRSDMVGVTFTPFPKPTVDEDRCRKWIKLCGNAKLGSVHDITRNHYVCSKHFVGGRGPTSEYPDPVPAPVGKVEHRVFLAAADRKRMHRKALVPSTLCTSADCSDTMMLSDPARPNSRKDQSADGNERLRSCHFQGGWTDNGPVLFTYRSSSNKTSSCNGLSKQHRKVLSNNYLGEDHNYCMPESTDMLDVQCEPSDAADNSSMLCDGPTTEQVSSEMELSCETFEVKYSVSGCWDEEPAACSAPFQPSIINIGSLTPADYSSDFRTSPCDESTAFVEHRADSPNVPDVEIKQEKLDWDCHVALERLPERLVRAASTSRMIVSDRSNTLLPYTSGAEPTVCTDVVKTEPELVGFEDYEQQQQAEIDQYEMAACNELDVIGSGRHEEQETVESKTVLQPSVVTGRSVEPGYCLHCRSRFAARVSRTSVSTTTEPEKNVDAHACPDTAVSADAPVGMPVFDDRGVETAEMGQNSSGEGVDANFPVGANRASVGTMTDTATAVSSDDPRCVVPDRLTADVSAIILKAVKQRNPGQSAAAAADVATGEQQNLSGHVLDMLQRQNSNYLPSPNSGRLERTNTNEADGNPLAQELIDLREMLNRSRLSQVATAIKWRREEMKVQRLQAKVQSLRQTVNRLTALNNSASVGGMPDNFVDFV